MKHFNVLFIEMAESASSIVVEKATTKLETSNITLQSSDVQKPESTSSIMILKPITKLERSELPSSDVQMPESTSSVMILKPITKLEGSELPSSGVQMPSSVQLPNTKVERSDAQLPWTSSMEAMDVDTAWSLFTTEDRVERMFVEHPSPVISTDGQEEMSYVCLPSTLSHISDNTTDVRATDVKDCELSFVKRNTESEGADVSESTGVNRIHPTAVHVSDVAGLDSTYFDLQESKFLVNLHRDYMDQSQADIDMDATKLHSITCSGQNRPSRKAVDLHESKCVVNLNPNDMHQSKSAKQINDININVTTRHQNRRSRKSASKQIDDIDINATKLPSLKSLAQGTKCVVKLRRIDDMHQSKSAKQINDIDINGTTRHQNRRSRKSPSEHITPVKTASKSR